MENKARASRAAGAWPWLALAGAVLGLAGGACSAEDSAPVDISTAEVSTIGQSARVGGADGKVLRGEHPAAVDEASQTAGRWFVDAIEDGAAVLIDEAGQVWAVDTSAIPADAREGAIFAAMGTLPGAAPDCARERCLIDETAARQMVVDLAARRDRLWAGDDGGNIRL